MNYNDIAVPATQRALVLQGVGALGAYEVGVLKVLFDKLIEGKGSGKKEGPLFDIVAGTSMGAMNAAVLISNIVNRNKTWEEAAEELEIFGQMSRAVCPLLLTLANGGGMMEMNKIKIIKI